MIEIGTPSGSTVELRFRLPCDHPGQPVGVAGDFNGWDWTATPLDRDGGALGAVVRVTAPGRYEFRYRSARGDWFNDEQADDYVGNEFGGVNCVVVVPAVDGDH
ncbi:MAG: isoamylase early set domain-containing protein [Ilumatobacteraceae bacterium]